MESHYTLLSNLYVAIENSVTAITESVAQLYLTRKLILTFKTLEYSVDGLVDITDSFPISFMHSLEITKA